jgi:hypothetical protein
MDINDIRNIEKELDITLPQSYIDVVLDFPMILIGTEMDPEIALTSVDIITINKYMKENSKFTEDDFCISADEYYWHIIKLSEKKSKLIEFELETQSFESNFDSLEARIAHALADYKEEQEDMMVCEEDLYDEDITAAYYHLSIELGEYYDQNYGGELSEEKFGKIIVEIFNKLGHKNIDMEILDNSLSYRMGIGADLDAIEGFNIDSINFSSIINAI